SRRSSSMSERLRLAGDHLERMRLLSYEVRKVCSRASVGSGCERFSARSKLQRSMSYKSPEEVNPFSYYIRVKPVSLLGRFDAARSARRYSNSGSTSKKKRVKRGVWFQNGTPAMPASRHRPCKRATDKPLAPITFCRAQGRP